MKSIFNFESMITPKIITALYWVLLLFFVGLGLYTMFVTNRPNILMGLIYLVGGCIGSRIWCELMIILFKINENLQKVAKPSSSE